MFFRKNKRQAGAAARNQSEQTSKQHDSAAGLRAPGSSQSSLNQTSNGSNNRSADKLLGANHTSIDLIDDIALDLNDSNDNQACDERDSFLDNSRTSRTSNQQHDSIDNNHKTSKTARLARAETIEEDNSNPINNQNNVNNKSKSSKNPFIANIPYQQPQHQYQQDQDQYKTSSSEKQQQQTCSCSMFCRMLVKKSPILIPLLILSCMAAIYCIPFVDVQPRIPKRLPNIPFNFNEGPLKPSDASQFKVERLFYNQIHGPESLALDSSGNMFMAIEGGFILYAHVNTSSPPNKAFANQNNLVDNSNRLQQQQQDNNMINQNRAILDPNAVANAMLNQYLISARTFQLGPLVNPRLFKIAELNPIKQMTMEQRRREGVDYSASTSWRRECQLDEQIYGRNLWSTQNPRPESTSGDASGGQASASISHNNNMEFSSNNPFQEESINQPPKFYSRVIMSRCSKPLGIRLSPDENYLYVIDTLNGLYKIHLRVNERLGSNQKLVTKLIDFKYPKYHLLPVTFLDLAVGQFDHVGSSGSSRRARASSEAATELMLADAPSMKVRAYLNTSLMAVDDMVIDYGAGSRTGGDIIYLTIASQRWIAIGFVYDYVEGRPTGAILRLDTSTNQLSVLSPHHVSHVRTSMTGHQLYNEDQTLFQWFNEDENDMNNNNYYHLNSINKDQSPVGQGGQAMAPIITTTPTAIYADRADYPMNESSTNVEIFNPFGVPRLDENDIFDDRPLHFPNGLELTDDKQALLIADTANKRIIKHFIRGPRKGTSDLWAWTPNFPDNIRRGYDKFRETYWVVGCGEDTTDKIDIMVYLHSWPRLKKYLLKNIYLFGWFVESIGTNIIKSAKIRDLGFAIRTGSSLCESMCHGMMILQYDSNGKLIRSIYGKEFPSDLSYYSQANEVIDRQTNQHYLYLSSPSYNYVTKLYLPPN